MRHYIAIIVLFFQAHFISAQSVGKWSFSSQQLPVYEYTGRLPNIVLDKLGKDSYIQTDPYFLLGNYRLSLFVHASGIYQFMTGERAWARVNADENQQNYGSNNAQIIVKKGKNYKKTDLIGLKSIAIDTQRTQKLFGVGFAKYTYRLDEDLSCQRVISVKPSTKINTGNPAFVVSVTLKNSGKVVQELTYSEGMKLNYTPSAIQLYEPTKRPVSYLHKISVDKSTKTTIANLTCTPNLFLNFPSKNQRYIYDVNPPNVFMSTKSFDKDIKSYITVNHDTLSAHLTTILKPGETHTFHIIVGLNYENSKQAIQEQINELLANVNPSNNNEGFYQTAWKKQLPDFTAEKDQIIKREMLWNAYTLEAMATYCAYYGETIIPQGTIYAYHFGDNISNRDHLQAALPVCYTNPNLAKSIIRYVIMHSETDGEIKRGDAGNGCTPPSLYKESDEQLYFFNTLSQYLASTKDYAFLNEKVWLYPAENKKGEVVLNILKNYFVYLRDEIGRGSNGLVKMLNSDWSDSFFHENSPNVYAATAESHLNSVMVLAIFPKLITELKKSKNPEATALIIALENYRKEVSEAYFKDFGNRKFSARAYLNHRKKYGIDNVCIEPQGYLLQIPDLSISRKKEIYQYVKSKIYSPEKIGFRTREKPLWSTTGEGEDGGIWFSLEGSLIAGVATFDKQEAKELLHTISFQNFTDQYPSIWLGQWTGGDNVNSTLSQRDGLCFFWEKDRPNVFQGFCSHPHAWPLYCYLKIKE
ncbi:MULTISPECIES: GH36-type glycosyl hydrolase domain-containing protein [unclassified Arcicella]|nr:MULTISPECIES: hypothetical protein [unclassified Arcicella]MDR6562118.1 cellobiose phosphorylase [Arcicella sp. BE51]MDR6812187.1 cellobiose phosphorylase [Arcicella sp. BE140]MDR6823499.1 cellobiose phosphorylase [Arcicella sp. BE139]